MSMYKRIKAYFLCSVPLLFSVSLTAINPTFAGFSRSEIVKQTSGGATTDLHVAASGTRLTTFYLKLGAWSADDCYIAAIVWDGSNTSSYKWLAAEPTKNSGTYSFETNIVQYDKVQFHRLDCEVSNELDFDSRKRTDSGGHSYNETFDLSFSDMSATSATFLVISYTSADPNFGYLSDGRWLS